MTQNTKSLSPTVIQVLLLNALQDPIPRSVFDYILRSQLLERVFSTLQERNYIRNTARQGHTPVYPELDDSMSQVNLPTLSKWGIPDLS